MEIVGVVMGRVHVVMYVVNVVMELVGAVMERCRRGNVKRMCGNGAVYAWS